MNNCDKNSKKKEICDLLIKQYYTIYGNKINNAVCLLESLGVHEFAWDYKNVFSAIEIMKNKRIPIVGGDVCYMNNGNIEYTYDTWTIDYTNNKSSYEQSIDFINDYISVTRNDKIYLFVLVFDYKKYLGLHRDDEEILYIH